MDRKAIQKRKQNLKMSDQDFAQDFKIKLFKELQQEGNIPHVFLDSWYDATDRHEDKIFKKELGELKRYLMKFDRLETAEISENIKSEHPELNEKVLAAQMSIDEIHFI